jgi:hypothetical protein
MRRIKDCTRDRPCMGAPPGGTRLPIPVERPEGWAALGGSANRLWDRGAFGRPIQDGILLTAAELLNAHRLRGLPLPSENWLAGVLENDGDVLFEAEILDALRYPGEKVVLGSNLIAVTSVMLHQSSWALRWLRSDKPSEDEPTAELRWMKAGDAIDWAELSQWVATVEAGGRIPEILVVDDEHGVVTYRAHHHNPRGEFPDPFSELGNVERRAVAHAWAASTKSSGGNWLPISSEDWPIPSLGLDLSGGIWLDEYQSRSISKIVNPSMPSPEGEMGVVLAAFEDLIERGLLVRPAFKYGTRWRAYSGAIDEGHAPWLIVTMSEAPPDWAQACLSARLAAGVNKIWLCSIPPGVGGSGGKRGFTYLALERPPADARWTSPTRH